MNEDFNVEKSLDHLCNTNNSDSGDLFINSESCVSAFTNNENSLLYSSKNDENLYQSDLSVINKCIVDKDGITKEVKNFNNPLLENETDNRCNESYSGNNDAYYENFNHDTMKNNICNELEPTKSFISNKPFELNSEENKTPNKIVTEEFTERYYFCNNNDVPCKNYINNNMETPDDNKLVAKTLCLEKDENIEYNKEKTFLYDHENKLYDSNAVDKLNTNESESIAELSAITTQNFNLINNDFNQQNRVNRSDEAPRSCIVEETKYRKVIRNSEELISSVCNVNSVTGYECNQNVDTEVIESDQMNYSKDNTTENVFNATTHNGSFLDAELCNTYEEINNRIRNEGESVAGIDNCNILFPLIMLPNINDLNCKKKIELNTDNLNRTRTNVKIDKVLHIDNLITKNTVLDYTESNSSTADSDTHNISNKIPDTHNISNKIPDTVFQNVVIKSSLKRPNTDDSVNCSKKIKKGITFDKVSVYYFPRTQGFTCIPSQGGSTLGMSWNHTHTKTYSLGEHAAEQRRVRRQHQLTDTWDELPNTSSEDSETDEQLSDSELDFENCNFLQPIATKERRSMLRASGVRKIDSSEKDECRQIRLSREYCGCSCQTYCDPDTCTCSQAGIKCQVDRLNFPCSCSHDGCVNPNGRIEFNPVRVRTHYIHTLMRMELEKKQLQEQMNIAALNSGVGNNFTSAALTGNNTQLQNAVTDGFLNNFRCSSADLQSYYQQQQMQSSPYNISIGNSCFNFNYNQFFSAYQQQPSSSIAFNLEPPRAIDYHSSVNLYDTSTTTAIFDDDNNTVADDVRLKVNTNEIERFVQEQCDCTDDGDKNNATTTPTKDDFADLLLDNETTLDDSQEKNLKYELTITEIERQSEQSQIVRVEEDDEEEDEELIVNTESENSDDLGELMNDTIVETVTT